MDCFILIISVIVVVYTKFCLSTSMNFQKSLISRIILYFAQIQSVEVLYLEVAGREVPLLIGFDPMWDNGFTTNLQNDKNLMLS